MSESVLRGAAVYWAALVLVIIILVGIGFDIVGLATATASLVSINAMAAKRLPGARQALRLVRNAARVAVICNDLIGDICGTVSGAAGTAIVIRVGLGGLGEEPAGLAGSGGLWTVLAVAAIAAVTVGGKAVGKNLAIDQADRIVYQVGRLLWWLEDKLGIVILRDAATPRRAARRKVRRP